MSDQHEFRPYADMPEYCVAELPSTGDTCNRHIDEHVVAPMKETEMGIKIDAGVIDTLLADESASGFMLDIQIADGRVVHVEARDNWTETTVLADNQPYTGGGVDGFDVEELVALLRRLAQASKDGRS